MEFVPKSHASQGTSSRDILTDVGHHTNHLFAEPTCLECAIASNILDVPDTVLFAILDQSTCLWALLVAKLMGVSKISNNTVLRKYIGLQHI